MRKFGRDRVGPVLIEHRAVPTRNADGMLVTEARLTEKEKRRQLYADGAYER